MEVQFEALFTRLENRITLVSEVRIFYTRMHIVLRVWVLLKTLIEAILSRWTQRYEDVQPGSEHS